MIRASPDWFPDWSGETCAIIACGPSAKDYDLNVLKGRVRCIAINNSWKLVPWADILYGCDGAWWRKYEGVPEFKGLKITLHNGVATHFNLKLVSEVKSRFDLIIDHPGCVGSGGNSGFHSVNLAVQFGCKKIILVGYDMSLDQGFHWFGKHPSGMNNPGATSLDRWRERLDNVSKQLKGLGITVINTSLKSALRNYKKQSLIDALA